MLIFQSMDNFPGISSSIGKNPKYPAWEETSLALIKNISHMFDVDLMCIWYNTVAIGGGVYVMRETCRQC